MILRNVLKQRLINAGVFLATVLVLLGGLELTMRLTGFTFVLYPEEIEFGRPDPVLLKAAFREDAELYWVTKNYPEKLERLRRERPELVFMGDSCTQFSRYDEVLVERLAQLLGRRPSFGNLAVAGWSSYQGARQLERDVAALKPRVVAIFYGWNDHWIGFGIEDKNVARVKRLFSSRVSHSRVVQLLSKGWIAAASWRTDYPNRVELDDYRDNLRRMVRRATSLGIRPVLLTAPTSHRRGFEPSYLAERWLRDLSELVPLHQAYVEATRQVAAETATTLCDLAADFAELPRQELEQSFMEDGIHFTPEGTERVAAFLERCFVDQGVVVSLGAGPPA